MNSLRCESSTHGHLAPPFSKDSAIRSYQNSTSLTAYLPSTFRQNDRLCDPQQEIETFLHADLRTPKLSAIQQYLWLAGLPRPARPLHRQRLLGRLICVTEKPDEHLLWHEKSIFIKPLPEYLLSFELWEGNICGDDILHRSACGLLMSYAWLVSTRSDHAIARETGLLPVGVEWDSWTAFIWEFISHINVRTLNEVDNRYVYGELRLSRLNSLYRIGAAGWSSQNIVHGYMSGSQRYTTFFERNFGWVVAVFVYVTVILSAMQVALATEKFGHNSRFQGFSYGISLTSMAFVLMAVGTVLVVWLGLFMFHLTSTIQYCKNVQARRHQVDV